MLEMEADDLWRPLKNRRRKTGEKDLSQAKLLLILVPKTLQTMDFA